MNKSTTPLRDLIEAELDKHWLAWAKDHPHLADAIDRTRLIESTVARLRDEPAYLDAIRRADRDEQRLNEIAELTELVDRWVRRVLPGLA